MCSFLCTKVNQEITAADEIANNTELPLKIAEDHSPKKPRIIDIQTTDSKDEIEFEINPIIESTVGTLDEFSQLKMIQDLQISKNLLM